jgi:tetratricopeptide (TPR) repeat protein
MTRARAASLAAGTAVAVYLGTLGNGFALDDGPVVERNPAAHSVAAALQAFGHSYWPPQHGAGQWRPLVILSFAIDWQLSGGSAVWLHAANLLWHAAATGALVLVAAPYVTEAGALVAGLLFAVHPVHVEAVANLVGRAELMAGLFLFLSVLLGRAVRRRRADGHRSWPVEAALLIAVACGLLSKEHAAVAVALLALDDLATRRDAGAGLPLRDYAGVAILTVAWFLVRRPIDAGRSFAMVAPTFFSLGAAGRAATMLPVTFVLVRLLAWPFSLSPDYLPEVVPRLEHLTPLGLAGLALLLGLAGLAAVSWRRHRGLSVGLLIIGIAWLPTSNLLFPTGVVIAERTLYLASGGAALIGGVAYDWAVRRGASRVPAVLAGALVLAFAARTTLQVPVWRSNRDLVLWGLDAHPESYREHQVAARALVRMGQLPAALQQYAIAIELYPLDYYNLAEAGATALDASRPRLALGYLRSAERLDDTLAVTQALLSRALLALGSPREAVAHARRAVAALPRQPEAAGLLAAGFVALGERDSAIAVWPAFRQRGGSRFEGWLREASTLAAIGEAEPASAALDSALQHAPPDSVAASRVAEVRALIVRAQRQ